jgi:hypothetical protein
MYGISKRVLTSRSYIKVSKPKSGFLPPAPIATISWPGTLDCFGTVDVDGEPGLLIIDEELCVRGFINELPTLTDIPVTHVTGGASFGGYTRAGLPHEVIIRHHRERASFCDVESHGSDANWRHDSRSVFRCETLT